MKKIPTTIYERVAEEMRAGQARAGLVAQAFSECAGDKAKSEARYIALRAAELHREAEESERAQKEIAREQAMRDWAVLNAKLEEEKQIKKRQDEQEVDARDPSMGRFPFFVCVAVFATCFGGIANSVTPAEAGWLGWWVLSYSTVLGFLGWLRTRNIGCSPWVAFWLLVPIVSIPFFLYLLFAPPNSGVKTAIQP